MERFPDGMTSEPFDDFLGLASRDFSSSRLIVFGGRSGSGKTTAIQFLLAHHADFEGRSSVWIEGPPFPRVAAEADVIVADEITAPRHLLVLSSFLRRCATLIVASHLSNGWFHLFRPIISSRIFSTDRDAAKIGRHLARRGVAASQAALDAYVRTFGATYTDAEVILERYPSDSFDASLARFLARCRLELSPVRREDPAGPWRRTIC